MKRNVRKAFGALKSIGAPVHEPTGDWGALFFISGEDNYPETWADYYDARTLERVLDTGEIVWAFGVNPKITRILKANNLQSEWINPGLLGVYNV